MFEKLIEGANVNSAVANLKLNSINHEPVTVPINGGLAVRLYRDCRPNCLETASLQKGLILMLDSRELIEEGVGFGLPVIKYEDKTYFSGSAEVSIQKASGTCKLTKTYVLDSISKKLWQDHPIDDRLYSPWRKKFANLYLSHKELSPLFNRIMELRDVAKVKTEFTKVKPRGKINVNYEIQPSAINVNVDFSDVTLDKCEELLVLNEQGSNFFGNYIDGTGLRLVGSRIGGWAAVTAEHATLQSVQKRVGFRLQKISGAMLFRGWEKTRNRFSWVGLSYSLRPNVGTFAYSIKLEFNRDSQRYFISG